MSSAWTFQKAEEVEKVGEEKASWYVGWYEPDGTRRKKSFGPGARGKDLAGKFRRKVEAEMMTGIYRSQLNKTWEDFHKEYASRVLDGLSARSKETALVSLAHFERIVGPKRVHFISAQTVADFVSKRRLEHGKKRGELLSPASVNKDLRHIKAALAAAAEWGYLAAVPKVRMERAGKKLPTYVTGDHFAAVYGACGKATRPAKIPHVEPADWWRALLVTGYMTGWRIGDMLNLRREDVDLEAGTAVIRWEAEGNKGKRDELVKLHPAVVEHMRKVPTFGPFVFPWPYHRRMLYKEFLKVQQAAGINLPCRKDHEHTPACHVYGFHDLRRAFATMNADKLTPETLMSLMRHKSYQTTMIYINLGRQMDAAVASLHVPEVLKGVVS